MKRLCKGLTIKIEVCAVSGWACILQGRLFKIMKKIFVLSANRTVKILDLLKSGFNSEVVGVLVYEPWDYPLWSEKSTDVKTWGWNQISNYRINSSQLNMLEYEYCLYEVLKDVRVHYLLERHFHFVFNSSVFNNVTKIEILVHNCLSIIGETLPNIVYFTHPPHNFVSFVFAKIAQIKKIDVLSISHTPLHYRKWIVHGVDDKIPVQVGNRINKNISAKGLENINYQKFSYKEGIPDYSKKALQGSWNWRRELRNILSVNPKKILSKIYNLNFKRKIYRACCEYSTQLPNNKNYAAFFLHYQPEATTLPDGLGYSQQWLAITRLRMAMPPEQALAVKEHPGLFVRERLRPGFRDETLYRAIKTLPNTFLVPIDSDPYQLIDGSVFVATITGTVGWQALVREKPVIYFGAAPYHQFPKAFKVSNAKEIHEAINSIQNGSTFPWNDEILSYVSWIESISYGYDNYNFRKMLELDYINQCTIKATDDLVKNDFSFSLANYVKYKNL